MSISILIFHLESISAFLRVIRFRFANSLLAIHFCHFTLFNKLSSIKNHFLTESWQLDLTRKIGKISNFLSFCYNRITRLLALAFGVKNCTRLTAHIRKALTNSLLAHKIITSINSLFSHKLSTYICIYSPIHFPYLHSFCSSNW